MEGWYYFKMKDKPNPLLARYNCILYPISESLPPLQIPIQSDGRIVIYKGAGKDEYNRNFIECSILIPDKTLVNFLNINHPVYVSVKVEREVIAGNLIRKVINWEPDWGYLTRVVLTEKSQKNKPE